MTDRERLQTALDYAKGQADYHQKLKHMAADQFDKTVVVSNHASMIAYHNMAMTIEALMKGVQMLAEYAPGHKYDSAITHYMDVNVMGDSGYDDIATHPSDGVCEGAALIGKRVLYWDDQGFVSSYKFANISSAKAAFNHLEIHYRQMVKDWQRGCEHKRWDINKFGTECPDCEAYLMSALYRDCGATYEYMKVEQYPGVAFHVDWYDTENDRVGTHMVGDDELYVFGRDECLVIDEDDFCSLCGQIGCGW